MICGGCGKDAPNMAHHFFKGNPEKPERKWTINAPLYFKANVDNTTAVEGYCSAKCAAKALAY